MSTSETDDSHDQRPAKKARTKVPSQDDLLIDDGNVESTQSSSNINESLVLHRHSQSVEYGSHNIVPHAQPEGHRFRDVSISGNNNVIHLGDNNRFGQSSTGEDIYPVLLKSLSFRKIDFRVNNVHKPLHLTCEWLLEHEHFKTWYTAGKTGNHNGFLWLKGKPGSGKSTLMKHAYEWTRRGSMVTRAAHKAVKDTIIPYFFSARGETALEKSTLGLYRTVVFQMLTAFPSLKHLFIDKFGASKTFSGSEAQWTIAELQDFLLDTVTAQIPYSLCLFVDALDEAQYQDEVRQMIKFLVTLAERAQQPDSACRWQVCLSSRHYPHISIEKGLEIVVEHQPQHTADIDAYIAKNLIGMDGTEKQELSLDIRNKAANMFLWVVLVVDMLNGLGDDGSLLADMKACLSTLPMDLDELFQQIMTRDANGLDTSIVLFQWVLFSKRSLEPAELFVAIQYSLSLADNGQTATNITCPVGDRLKRYILHCSRGLVEVTTRVPETVQFIHETVREFFVSNTGLAALLTTFPSSLPASSHDMIKLACARCIKEHEIPDTAVEYVHEKHQSKYSLELFVKELRCSRPFLDYAVAHLFDHAEQAQLHGMAQATFLQSQVDLDGRLLETQRQWWNVLTQHKVRKQHKHISLIYFLSELHYPALLSELFRSSTIPKPEIHGGRYCSPLGTACIHGFVDCVDVLLSQGANIQFSFAHGHKGCKRLTIFDLALPNWAPIFPVLKKHGISLDKKCFHQILLAAIGADDLLLVADLLELGADINFGTGDNVASSSISPLVYAATHKGVSLELMQLLIDAGAEVNARGRRSTPLEALCITDDMHSSAKARILIENGADPNTRPNGYESVFEMSLRYGWHDVSVSLIIKGLDIHSGGRFSRNNLQAAAFYDDVQIVALLIANGAAINAQAEYGGTALLTAISNSSLASARCLIAHGADLEQGESYADSPLIRAIQQNNRTAAELLLYAGANVNGIGTSFSWPLRIAVSNGYETLVHMLLSRGADVNARAILETADARIETDTTIPEKLASAQRIRELLLEHGAGEQKAVAAKDIR